MPFIDFQRGIATFHENQHMNLNGTWKPVKALMNGAELPGTLLRTIELVIVGPRYEATVGRSLDKGHLAVNLDTSPMRIDIKGESGPNKGRTMRCIFKQTENQLEILYDLSGIAYPTNFEVEIVGSLYWVQYERN